MIDYKKCLIEFIGHNDFELNKDVIFQDDGDGICISYFDIDGSVCPSIQDLLDIYNSNPFLYGAINNQGNTLVRYGKGDLEIDPRIEVDLNLNVNITDLNNEFDGFRFRSNIDQNINLSIKNNIKSLKKNKIFEIRIIKNNDEMINNYIYSFSEDVSNFTVIDNLFVYVNKGDTINLKYYNSDNKNTLELSDIELNIVGVQ